MSCLSGPPTSLLPQGMGGNESCHSISRQGPSHLRDRGASVEMGGLLAPAHIHPVMLSSTSSFHYILFCSEGWVGVGGLGSEEMFATFLHSLSALSTPISLVKTLLKGARWGGAGRGTQRESGELMIVHWKNDRRIHTPLCPKQRYPERGGKVWGGVGGWGEREERVVGQETSSTDLNVDF